MNKLETDFDWVPTCTPAQVEAALAYVQRHAPDLADVIFGLAQAREADQRVRLERGLRGARP